MDETKKWTLYLMFLVAGFTTGIGSIGLFPQFWLEYGMTGLIVHLVFLAILMYAAIVEAEKIIKSGYYFVELYNRILKKPAMMLAVLAVIIVFLSYYTANTMLFLLSPIVGTGTLGRLISKVIMIAIIFVILTRAKEKTFTIMAAGSMILVISAIVTTVAFISKIPPTAAFLGMAKHMIMSRPPITTDLIVEALERAIYASGLGFAFYLMLGSFMNERFNVKLIVGVGVLIQVIIGILSTITIIYAIAPTTPEELLKYVGGGEEAAISFMGKLPTILADYPGLLVLIALSLFFAGLTSILPTSEVGLQIIEFNTRVGRNKAAIYLMLLVLLVGIPSSVPSLAQALVLGVSTATLFTAIFEYLPVISKDVGKITGIQPTPLQMVTGAVLFAIFIPMGLYSLYTTAKSGGVDLIGALFAVTVVGLGVLGDKIVKKEEE